MWHEVYFDIFNCLGMVMGVTKTNKEMDRQIDG